MTNKSYLQQARERLHKAKGKPSANGDGKGHKEVKPRQAESDKAQIEISCEEHKVNDLAVKALTHDEAIFQRGGVLTRIVHDAGPEAGGIRRPAAPRIEPIPTSLLRERLTTVAQFFTVRETKDSVQEVNAHPPGWCVNAVHARANWPGVRHLEAVVEYPVLRPDGSVLSQRGYDSTTGLYVDARTCLSMPSVPSRDDARRAVMALMEAIYDFPFENEAHTAAWFAALLTPLARFAFTGPTPLFLVDANVRGSGKGLSLDCISRIVTGERFTIATYSSDENELRKRITSLALSGERLVLFDNLDGKFGNAVLDAALTGTSWEDRLLGVNRIVRAPLWMTWFATGNNVSVAADTARRICHIRLESPEEKPEERVGFRHPDLLRWVGENRAHLLSAALTILRGYFLAGCPDQKLPAWGSFEGWSRVVRAAVVWAGLPDPAGTRLQLQERADVSAEAMGVLLVNWKKLDDHHKGMTAAEVVHLVFGKKDTTGEPEHYTNLRDAIEQLVGRGDSKALGFKLRSFRRRIFQGLYFDRAGSSHQATRWAVFPASDFSNGMKHPPHAPHAPHIVGEDDEDGEDVSSNPETGQTSNDPYMTDDESGF